MRVVAGHLAHDMPEADLALHLENLREAMLREAGPQGFEYEFVKLYAIARRPA